MNYSEQHQYFRQLFDPSLHVFVFPGSKIGYRMLDFRSTLAYQDADDSFPPDDIPGPLSVSDDSILENRVFRYPVFMDMEKLKDNRAIILLHGLNEKSWSKYLCWAYTLAEQTSRPVILFPIAFHINRAPKDWGNPRVMASLLEDRKRRYGDIQNSTFVNVALSERLCENPSRFYRSGKQSALDLMQLIRQINAGEHPMIEKGGTIDFFSYSIGSFLAQILLIGNPSGLFTGSRLFLFCGGAFFEEMNGNSRLIMDQSAFKTLQKFFLFDLPKSEKRYTQLAASMQKTELGMAFKAMLSDSILKSYREDRMQKLKDQMCAVTFGHDQVIPSKGISEALERFIPVDVLDFPEQSIHENPFPVSYPEITLKINSCFNEVFSKASAFLA